MSADRWAAQRLEAKLALAKSEARIYQALTQTLTAYLRAARREALPASLVAAAHPDPEGVARARSAFVEAMAGYLEPAIAASFGESFAAVTAGALVTDQRFREAFMADVRKRISSIPDAAYDRVRVVVAEGVAKGYAIDTIATGIRAALTLRGPSPAGAMAAADASEQASIASARLVVLRGQPASSRDASWDKAVADTQDARNEARAAYNLATERAPSDELFPEWRLRMIARTEAMASVNGGTIAAARATTAETGQELLKVWLATEDERTRPEHADADGQTVALSEPFEVDGEALDYPGDPAGSEGNVINCRCTILQVTPAEVAGEPASVDDTPDAASQSDTEQ